MDDTTIIKCAIVDDEKLARDLLEDLIRTEPKLQLIGTFKNTKNLRTFLNANAVDLLFLDIQMPEETGIDFLKTVTVLPKVVLTTAYPQYALESYDLEVLDYLLKPITEERFNKSMEKVKQLVSIEKKAAAYELINHPSEPTFLYLKSGANEYKIPYEEIELLEAASEYIKYWTKGRYYMVLGALKKVKEQLPAQQFIQVHRAFVVPIAAIKGREKYTLLLKSGKRIPIGKTYRQQVLKRLIISNI